MDRERCQMSIKPLSSFLRNGLRERVDFWNGRSRFFYPGEGPTKVSSALFCLIQSLSRRQTSQTHFKNTTPTQACHSTQATPDRGTGTSDWLTLEDGVEGNVDAINLRKLFISTSITKYALMQLCYN